MSPFRSVLLAALALCVVASPVVADDLKDLQNPLKDAKAGEWTKYKVSYSGMGGPPQEVPMKASVVKETETTVDLKSEMEIMGMPQENITTVERNATIVDALTGGGMAGPMGGQVQNVKILSSSVEDVDYEHDGTTYKAKKVSIEVSAEFSLGGAEGMGMPVKMKIVQIMSYDIPVSGVLKTDSTIQLDMGGAPMEIKASQVLDEFGTDQ